MDPREQHPRPQLARERWTDLCGTWQFAYDDREVGLDGRWFQGGGAFDRTITVPFPPESPASGIGDGAPHEVVWYRRAFTVPAQDREGRLLLHFGAVDYTADVWVDGQHVASHQGGHTPFAADITGALADADEHVVVVRAEDRLDMTQPRGKQDWQAEPHKIWYSRTTGIWQCVWLEPLPSVHLDDLAWTADLAAGLLVLEALVNRNPDRPLRLRVRLTLHDELLADATYALTGRELRQAIGLDAGRQAMERERLLWSPANPNLVDAVVTLLDGEVVVDEVHSYAGLRSVGLADGRFLLNGRPYYPRMVLAQNFWPESHLAAPDDAALRREVDLAKSLGFNGMRLHQKVEDPRFLYWCDRLGMMVWGEMANAYVFSARAVEQLTAEWMEVIRRDVSHPCIVTWLPLNESWGVPSLPFQPAQRHYVRALYSLTHALDPTRPVIGNDGWEHIVSDVWGVHDYEQEPAILTERYGSAEAVERTIREVQPYYRSIGLVDAHRQGEPVMLTECGGITDAPAAGKKWFGYGSAADPEAFLATYTGLLTAILDSPSIAGFCYTQLTDTEQETNGLLTAAREYKVDAAAIRAITTRASRAVPGEALDLLRRTSEAAVSDTPPPIGHG